MSKFLSMKRFSRSNSVKANQQSQPQYHGYDNDPSSPNRAYPPSASHNDMMSNGNASGHSQQQPQQQQSSQQQQHNSRPVSAGTDSSYEFANRPISHSIPQNPVGNLSRTDQIVLRHFWEYKYEDNKSRDLHFLRFPFFPQFPGHTDLVPYCEIYHLVKTSPGAKIISLGSANGVYIGFELFSGSQLHIDMDDEWTNISHHRVHFKSYDAIVKDPATVSSFKSWPKPLTIEFLEEQYRQWCLDLMSPCWEAMEVRELGSGGAGGTATGQGNVGGNAGGGRPDSHGIDQALHHQQQQHPHGSDMEAHGRDGSLRNAI